MTCFCTIAVGEANGRANISEIRRQDKINRFCNLELNQINGRMMSSRDFSSSSVSAGLPNTWCGIPYAYAVSVTV